MEQLAGVRRIEYQDGRASHLPCAMVNNGVLQFPLMLDKCLDPAWFQYKGVNLSFLSKPGLQGRNPYDTAGEEAIYSIQIKSKINPSSQLPVVFSTIVMPDTLFLPQEPV